MKADTLAVMQPYVFPYVGYFNLIEASDCMVFYDDVHYIKRGWINRNRILLNKAEYLFTVPVEGASQNRLILDTRPLVTSQFVQKFMARIEGAYKKAPHYQAVLPLLNEWLSTDHENIAAMAIDSIVRVYAYLETDFLWKTSSVASPETAGLEKSDRLIAICRSLDCSTYVNAANGQALYDRDYFRAKGVELKFVKPRLVEYRQFGNEFVPWLSILDVLMFNDKQTVRSLISAYDLC